jgi:hypothetical protein
MRPVKSDRYYYAAVPLLALLWRLNWPAVKIALDKIKPWALRERHGTRWSLSHLDRSSAWPIHGSEEVTMDRLGRRRTFVDCGL